MANFGKILGGGLGWAFGGPLGALLGVAAGEILIDAATRRGKGGESGYSQAHRHHTTTGDFGAALMALSAAVIKADGKILKSEIQFVREFYNQQFGVQKSNEYVRLLQELLKQDIPVRQICDQIRFNMKHPLRLELLHYLFQISKSDGHVDQSEIAEIKRIAYYLGISEKDFLSLKNMFYEDTDSAYKILEIPKSSSVSDIKKAYRRMANKYHPDKVAGLGKEIEENAKEKFQKVQEAYDKIKKEKKFK